MNRRPGILARVFLEHAEVIADELQRAVRPLRGFHHGHTGLPAFPVKQRHLAEAFRDDLLGARQHVFDADIRRPQAFLVQLRDSLGNFILL